MWVLTRPILDKFAKHYKTGKPMPQALVKKVDASSKFNQGYATVEYLSSAIVDMELHTKPDGVVDADAFERETLQKDRRAEGGRDAPPPAAVQPPVHERLLLGRLLQLPVVRGDGRRYARSVRRGGQRVRHDRPPTRCASSSSRRATRPIAPRPTASSAAAIPTSRRCSRSAASRRIDHAGMRFGANSVCERSPVASRSSTRKDL